MQARRASSEDPARESEKSHSENDLKSGRFAGAPSKSPAGKVLHTFFGPELNKTVTCISDQALFIEALLKEGFELNSVVGAWVSFIDGTLHYATMQIVG